jgi:hypothetical protein
MSRGQLFVACQSGLVGVCRKEAPASKTPIKEEHHVRALPAGKTGCNLTSGRKPGATLGRGSARVKEDTFSAPIF